MALWRRRTSYFLFLALAITALCSVRMRDQIIKIPKTWPEANRSMAEDLAENKNTSPCTRIYELLITVPARRL